jgi:TIR domain
VGPGDVFIDIDNMPRGRYFREHLKKTLDKVDVVLAIIGPSWLAVNPETQRPRLEDENDWVRIEISTALARPDVLVIPVAVDGASIPRPEQLPQDLKNLAFRSGFVFRNDDFSRNLERPPSYCSLNLCEKVASPKMPHCRRCVLIRAGAQPKLLSLASPVEPGPPLSKAAS